MDPSTDPAVLANPRALQDPPYNYIVYGPDANCTLAVCPAELGVYQYRPQLAANSIFIAFYGIALVAHAALGFRWRTWVFMGCMVTGCLSEMIGYGGRIMLYNNPFDFPGFLLQIICITFAPVFYTAAIYVTLTKIIFYLGPQYSRFAPKFYYWVFIPCDIFSLVLQSAGGGLSSESSGSSDVANGVSLGGLVFQVFTLVVFIGLAADYFWRFYKGSDSRTKAAIPARFKIFIFFLTLSIILILARCIYRIDELSEGYYGPLIKNEGLFIALEGVLVTIAAFTLLIGHEGYGLPKDGSRVGDVDIVKSEA